jgi:putative ABC transport system permease protein
LYRAVALEHRGEHRDAVLGEDQRSLRKPILAASSRAVHVILWKGQSGMDAEVIGVVGDSRERGPAAAETLTVYLPYGRIALPGEFVVHTRGNPLALVPAVRSIIAGLDPDLPVADVRSFEDVVRRSIAPQRFNTILLAVFGALAGIVLGAAAAVWLSRYFAALLFGVQPFDAPTYAAVAALLLATALAACYLPGRRAMRIDPAVALRIE